MQNTIIISDLDGTLLDSSTYSFQEALTALSLIQERGIPLILCSSKTRPEIERYRHLLNNQHPFISENGGGIFIPQGYFSVPVEATVLNGYSVITLGTPYADILYHFNRLRKRLPVQVRGFADMSNEEVAELSGLPWADARLAKQRDFDEPFIFEGAPDEHFLHAIESINLRWTQGRIFHIMGDHDKGRAVTILKKLYQQQYGAAISIGLGDSLNDLPMLQAVDRPVLVRHEDGSCDARIEIPGIQQTRLPGPAGWNETMLQLLVHEPCMNRQDMNAIFHAALAAVDPYNAVLDTVRVEHWQLQVDGAKYDLSAYERIVVIGAGKATARMAQAIEILLGKWISAGLIVIKDGHAVPLSIIEQVEAAHPVPNEAGIAGTQNILHMAQAADEKTLLICLLSGGASALLVAPATGLSLQDKQDTTELLLKAGVSIRELNAVRKHLSLVKGGRLAQAAYPAQVVTLIVSDVIGDSLDVIASGPTAQDNSTFEEAFGVITKYALQEKLSSRVANYLQRGIAGQEPETVKRNDQCLAKTRNTIIASNRQALSAAEKKAVQMGYVAKVISSTL